MFSKNQLSFQSPRTLATITVLTGSNQVGGIVLSNFDQNLDPCNSVQRPFKLLPYLQLSSSPISLPSRSAPRILVG